MVQPHRTFLREGPLEYINSIDKKNKKKEQFYFFAFNDILMKTKYNKKKCVYEFKELFELSRFYIRDVKYNAFTNTNSGLLFIYYYLNIFLFYI